MTVKLFIDDREIDVEEGANLLETCLKNEIYIPNLCHIEGAGKPSASCRLCFVEIEGNDAPLPSCALSVQEGMRVKTDSTRVRNLQKAAFELLLSAHEVDCGNCPANKRCGLQRIAKFLKVGLKPKRLEKHLKDGDDSAEHPVLSFFPNRCVLCGRCAYVCEQTHGKPFLTIAGRGFDAIISFYGMEDPVILPCGECRACVDICPVAAILLKDDNDSR
jgi:NADH dehydrogenase/NADH:ubiquinone oxidoreductase subunit G